MPGERATLSHPIQSGTLLCDYRGGHYAILRPEEMVADLLTKIVVGAQDARLTIRFYCLCSAGEYYVVHHM